jgi:hypothetical protein
MGGVYLTARLIVTMIVAFGRVRSGWALSVTRHCQKTPDRRPIPGLLAARLDRARRGEAQLMRPS